MIHKDKRVIGFPHRPPGIGGPGSFQAGFENRIRERGWTIVYPEHAKTPSIVLVVGGTRRLAWLLECKRRGTRIVHRLDGINWQHRKHWPGARLWLGSELANWLVRLIRGQLADVLVYQSQFVKDWLTIRLGPVAAPSYIIHNGVDLSVFSPADDRTTRGDVPGLLCVEGNIAGALPLHLWKSLKAWPIWVYGNVIAPIPEHLRRGGFSHVNIQGSIGRETVPGIFKGKRIYLSLDVNAACPNALIEAMASGIPVVGFDTGSLRELVSSESGRLVPYLDDPWQMRLPPTDKLAAEIDFVFANYNDFAAGARRRAQEVFDIDTMMQQYVDVIEGLLNGDGLSE